MNLDDEQRQHSPLLYTSGKVDLDAAFARLKSVMERDRNDPAVVSRIVDQLAEIEQRDTAYHAGCTALSERRLDAAEGALRQAASGGHPEAAQELAALLMARHGPVSIIEVRGNADKPLREAARWLLEAVNAGAVGPEDLDDHLQQLWSIVSTTSHKDELSVDTDGRRRALPDTGNDKTADSKKLAALARGFLHAVQSLRLWEVEPTHPRVEVAQRVTGESGVGAGWRVGDRLRYRGEVVAITGFVLGLNTSAPGDNSVEYVLLRYPNGDERVKEKADLVGLPCSPADHGADPFEGVLGWKLSRGWVERFNHLLQPTAGAPDLALPAAHSAQQQGELVLVTGGVVRDALRGATHRRGDIDLVGTLRAPAFRDLAVDVELEPYGGRRGGPDDRWHLRTRGPERFVTVFSPDEEHTVDYTAMRVDYRPHLLSASRPVWIYGTRLGADACWRDVTCNSLVYDPRTGSLYDPTEHGLHDLGLQPSDLAGEPPSLSRNEIVLRPIDVPENAPMRHVALQVAKVVLLVVRLAEGRLDTRPAEQWVERHADLIERALDHRDAANDRLPLITKELQSLPSATRLFGSVTRHHEHLARTFAANGLWPKLRSVIPTPNMVLRQGTDVVPRLVGTALRTLEPDRHGQWVAADSDVVGPSRPTTSAAAQYFREDLVGYEHTVDKVVIDDRIVADVLVLRPRHGEDGVRYMELDDTLQPIRPSDEQLTRLRTQYGDGTSEAV